jgi:hypothetical protein
VDPLVRAGDRLVGLRVQPHAARRPPRHRARDGGLRAGAGPRDPAGPFAGTPLRGRGDRRARRPVVDRPAAHHLPRGARRAAGLVRGAPGRRPRSLPRDDAAGHGRARADLSPAAPPRPHRRPRAGGGGPALRLEHRGRDPRRAGRRPRAGEAPRPPAAVPGVRWAPAGGGRVGPDRGIPTPDAGRRLPGNSRGRGGARSAVDALGPGPRDLRRPPLRAGVGPPPRFAPSSRLLAARAADAPVLPGGSRSRGGGLDAFGQRAALSLHQRQDRRRRRRRGRRAAEVPRPRAPASAPRGPARARDRLGVGGHRGLRRALPARVPRVRRDRARHVGGSALLRATTSSARAAGTT